jgi:hypothetical protein
MARKEAWPIMDGKGMRGKLGNFRIFLGILEQNESLECDGTFNTQTLAGCLFKIIRKESD